MARTTPDALLRQASRALHWARERRTSSKPGTLTGTRRARRAWRWPANSAAPSTRASWWLVPTQDRRPTGRIVGAEALARWSTRCAGLVRPDEFIPIVEQTNLLRPMTLLVLDLALPMHALTGAGLSCRSRSTCRRATCSIRTCRHVSRLLRRPACRATLLTLEVTESAMMADPEHAGSLARAARPGRAHLGRRLRHRLLVARLPAAAAGRRAEDRPLVRPHRADDNSRAIVRSTIELAHELGLDVVAEGVETRTLGLARRAACDLAQGLLFSEAGRPRTSSTGWSVRLGALQTPGAAAVRGSGPYGAGDPAAVLSRFPV